MRLPFSLFLAFKYMKPKRTFLSVVSLISVMGVMLGVMVLVIVISVMSGFDRMWQEKIFGFRSHVFLSGYSLIDEPELLMEKINEVEGVVSSSPTVQGQVFISYRDQVFPSFIKGINPFREDQSGFIASNMLHGVFSLEDDETLIGVDLARKIGAAVGDTLLVNSARNLISRDELLLPEELIVAGIFEIGMYEFDEGFMLTSLDIAKDLCGTGGGVHGIEIETGNAMTAPKTVEGIAEVLGNFYHYRTWMDMHSHLFVALKVEKNIMYFLLVFIVLVAAFGITGIMITTTYQKIREIGLLKAVGFSSSQISSVFLWQGFVVGLMGTLAGVGGGLWVLANRTKILDAGNRLLGIELLPKKLYHLSEIPAHTTSYDLVLISCLSMLFCTMSGVITSWVAARWDPMTALRHE